tara:strand:- start:567 stop:905 length:339 start_codon:yes stop_codon:yes gene_type:complete
MSLSKVLKQKLYAETFSRKARRLLLGCIAFILWPFISLLILGLDNLALPFESTSFFVVLLLAWVFAQLVVLAYLYCSENSSDLVIVCFQVLLALSNGFLFMLFLVSTSSQLG